MGTEQFCLRWNDFHQNITSAFSDIRDDEDFLDVTLVCDGDTVKAHRLVLSACSPLFRVMLKKNSHPQPMIFLRGIRYPDMVAILNFMYHGEVNVNQEDLQMFLAAAEELRIKGLSQTSTDSKVDSSIVPKKKIISLPSSTSLQAEQPPTKKLRESSPGISPVSTPVSAKSPIDHPDPEDESEPPQLSVKREFKSRDQNRDQGDGAETDDENSQQNNILDCLVQAQQTFQQTLQQQGGGQGASPNFEQNHVNNYNSPQHIMPGGGGTSALGSSQGDKDFLGRGSPNAMKFGLTGGLPYEMHRLGGRNEDGLAHVVVMKTFRGWHCPHCSYISPSQKGNLKVHILNRHANPGESFGCMFCGKHLSSRSSLQVHISQVHREQQKAKRMLEERLKINNLEDRLKTDLMGPGPDMGEIMRHTWQQDERIKQEMSKHGMDVTNFLRQNLLEQQATRTGFDSGPASSSGSRPQSPKHSTGGGEQSSPPGYSPGGPSVGDHGEQSGSERQNENQPEEEHEDQNHVDHGLRPEEQSRSQIQSLLQEARRQPDGLHAELSRRQPDVPHAELSRRQPEGPHAGQHQAEHVGHHGSAEQSRRQPDGQHGGQHHADHVGQPESVHGGQTGSHQDGSHAGQHQAGLVGHQGGSEQSRRQPDGPHGGQHQTEHGGHHGNAHGGQVGSHHNVQLQARHGGQHGGHHGGQQVNHHGNPNYEQQANRQEQQQVQNKDDEAIYHKEMGGDAVSVYPKDMGDDAVSVYPEDMEDDAVSVYPKSLGDAVSVYPKDMSAQPMIYRKEVGGHSVSIYPKDMQAMMMGQQGTDYGVQQNSQHHPLTSD